MSFRILDANFNRAREGLRVLEDVARFELGNAGLAASLKEMRHELDRLARPLAARLLAARDSVADVGRGGDLPDAGDVVAANAKRVEEALRSIEEHAKPIVPPVSRGAHSIRFRLYDVEPHLRGPRARIARARMYVILDSSVARVPLEKAAREALRGGAEMLQLREEGNDRKLLGLARRLVAIAHDHDALFLINDRADIAVAAEADGVHVGAADLPIEAARRVVGAYRIVGATTHTLAEAKRAKEADYVSVGPMFPSTTKPGLPARGASYLRAAKRLGVPHFCIGGISKHNVRPEMGRVAVCAGVLAERDIAAAVRAIRRRLP